MKRKTTPAPADNPELEKLVNRYSRESRILNPRPASGIETMLNLNDVSVLKTELLLLEGNDSGTFWNGTRKNSEGGNLHVAALPALKEARKALQTRFEIYQKSEIAMGNRVPKTWPSNLEDERVISDARIKVAEMEAEKLKELIAPIEAAEKVIEEAPFPRRRWSSCELKDGLLHKIAGWYCSFPENEDTLHIMDERSPFDGMPVWQFKSQILKAIEMEESYLKRMEIKQAEIEDRKPRLIKKVLTPTWNPETRQIEYPGPYSNATIKRLKIDM